MTLSHPHQDHCPSRKPSLCTSLCWWHFGSLIHGCPPVICPSRDEWWTWLRMGFRIILVLNHHFCCKGNAQGKVFLLPNSRRVKQSYQELLHPYTKPATRKTQASLVTILWCHKLSTALYFCRKKKGWHLTLPPEKEKRKQFALSSVTCPPLPYLGWSYWRSCVSSST